LTTIADVLHTIADHLPLPTGHDREQLHDAIDSATGATAVEDQAAVVVSELQEVPAATTAYGPGAMPTIQGGPYAAPLAPEATAALLGQGRVG